MLTTDIVIIIISMINKKKIQVINYRILARKKKHLGTSIFFLETEKKKQRVEQKIEYLMS